MKFRLRFNRSRIASWADHQHHPCEDHVVGVVSRETRRLGCCTKPALVDVCRWKTPRSQPRVAANDEEFIRAVTRTALSTESERLRIEVLTLLRGVDWPTASVLLHFGHTDPYPILDFRALWSLGVSMPSRYDFSFWWDYTRACRELAEAAGVSMRTLDRALWQYSKEHQ